MMSSEPFDSITYETAARDPFAVPENPVDPVALVSREYGLTRARMPHQAKVAVIGAGAAGLVAAFELARVGVLPVIYEISDRLGGRLYSYHFPGDPRAIAELGAMRFPPTATTLYYYLQAFGLETGIFPDPLVVPTTLYFHNKRYVCRSEADLPEPLQHVAKKWNDFVGQLLLSHRRAGSDFQARHEAWQDLVERYADINFYQALAANGWSREEINLFGSLGLGTGGFDSFYSVSFLEILRIVCCRWEKEQKLIKGGVEQLALKFWSEHRECRRFGVASVSELNDHTWLPGVNYIVKDGQHIRIQDQKGGLDSFDAAILACALSAIQCNIEIGPEIFSPAVLKAMRCVHHIGSTKVFVRTKTAFWRGDEQFPSCAITDELTRGTYLFDFDDTKSGVVCLSYTWEDDSHKFLPLSPDERVEVCIKTLERVLGCERFRAEVEEIISISWEQSPYTHGAFKLNYPGQYADQMALFQQNRAADPAWDNGVYLAGDSVSFSGGWVDGALQTGIHAALCAIEYIRRRSSS